MSAFHVYEYRNHLGVCVGGGGLWHFSTFFIFHLKSRVFKIHGFFLFNIRVQPLTSELEFQHFNLAGTGEGGGGRSDATPLG